MTNINIKEERQLMNNYVNRRRYKELKRFAAIIMSFVIALTIMPAAGTHAAKKIRLNKSKLTLEVGQKTKLTLKNLKKGTKVKWSSSKKKVASVTKKGKVTAKKAGKAKITAKEGNKKYTCKVTVTAVNESQDKKGIIVPPADNNATSTPETGAVSPTENPTVPPTGDPGVQPTDEPVIPPTKDPGEVSTEDPGLPPTKAPEPTPELTPTPPPTPTPAPKNEADMEAVQNIIESQRAQGVSLSGNLNSEIYEWNNEGRLVGIKWDSSGLVGNIVFSELTALKSLDVTWNTQLTGVDFTGCESLQSVSCYNSGITDITLTGCKALKTLYCWRNQIESIDFSDCTALEWLSCEWNPLTVLELGKCTSLEYVMCSKGVDVRGFDGEIEYISEEEE